MTPAEAQLLLSMAASFDNRKPDPDAAKAWAAALDDLRFEDCRLALIEHYKTSTDWLMPAMVRTIVKRIRSKRVAEFGDAFDVPPDLEGADYNRFVLDVRRRAGDGELTTADEIETPGRKERHLPDLRALMPSVDRDAGHMEALMRGGARDD